MELEQMFSEQKWNILKCLSNNSLSPMQLSEKLNTTMANVSQQLRLLEAANLVKKVKIKNRDKGKPRTLFSLSDDYAYLIPAMHNFADKRLLRVKDHHKIILKIWFLENEGIHKNVERSYNKIEPFLDSIEMIAVNTKTGDFIVISDKKIEISKILEKNPSLKSFILGVDEASRLLKQKKSPFAVSDGLSVIYDKSNLLKKMEVPTVS